METLLKRVKIGLVWKNSMLFLGSFIILSTSLLLNSCSSMLGVSDEDDSQVYRSYSNRPADAGKCYAKCLIQDQYETYEEELMVYTGSDTNVEGIELQTVVFRPATTIWEKKPNPNCKSRNPNDCLVWCMVDIPEISEDYYVVKDTNHIKAYKIEVVNYKELVKSGGFTEWREVVCEADISERLYTDIQLALKAKGYGEGIVPDGMINRITKEALVKYQKENGLPVGSLDYETLDTLGVRY